MDNNIKIKLFTQLLFDKYGIGGEIGFGTGSSCNAFTYQEKIIYGQQVIDTFFSRGFWEYKSVRWVWKKLNIYQKTYKPTERWEQDYALDIRGDVALWCLVLHEVAHLVDTMNRGTSDHGPEFQNTLMKLAIENFWRDNFWEAEIKPTKKAFWETYAESLVP